MGTNKRFYRNLKIKLSKGTSEQGDGQGDEQGDGPGSEQGDGPFGH